MTKASTAYPTVRIPFVRHVIAFVLLSGAFMDMPGLARMEYFSLLAVLTFAYTGIALVCWLSQPFILRVLLISAAPLAWSAFSLLWTDSMMHGVQNLLVYSAFWGLLVLLSHYAYGDLGITKYVDRVLLVAIAIAVFVDLGSLLCQYTYGFRLVGPRSFGLYALLALAWSVSFWRYGSRLGALGSVLLVVLIAISLSRTALVIGLLLVVLRFVPLKFSFRSWAIFSFWLTAIVILGVYTILTVQPLHDRFFTGDTSLVIGETAINTSGRTNFWRITLDSCLQSTWIGHGAGSSMELIERLYPGIGHPHNDYLRIAHDYGVIGLALWALAGIRILQMTATAWICRNGRGDKDARVHMAATLSLFAVALSMVTDNTVVYVFVMAPLAVLVGLSLGQRYRYTTDM